MVPDANAPEYFYDDAQAREYADMRAVVVVQDSPQRLRVIRFSPAQRLCRPHPRHFHPASWIFRFARWQP